MSHHSPTFHSGSMGSHWTRGGQQNPPGRFPPADPNVLLGEIQRLNYLLEMERAGRFEDNQRLAHLEAELEETKLQLKKEKDLKETFINQAKEAKRELERAEKFSDPAVLNAAVTASQVHNDVKYMKTKSLEQDFEELKVANLLSREAFVAEVQAERKKSEALQEQLNQLQTSLEELKREKDATLEREKENLQLIKLLRAEKEDLLQNMSREITIWKKREKQMIHDLVEVHVSQQELKRRCKSKLMDIQQHVETYMQQRKEERKAHLQKTEEYKVMLDKLRAEKEELRQKISGEIRIRQKMEKQLLYDMDQIQIYYKELKCRYKTDMMDLHQQIQTYKQQLKDEREDHLEKTEKDKVLLDKLRAENANLQGNTTSEIESLQDKERKVQAELEEVDFLYLELNCQFETKATARDDLLQPDSQRAEEEDFQNQVDPVNASSQEVSSQEGLSAEPLPGGSTNPETSEEIETSRETVLEHLDHPDAETMKDGKKKKSKISFWKKIQKSLRWKRPKRKHNSEDDQEQV